MEEKHIITIDGPCGVGKSTVAEALAKKLGYKYINTGFMFVSVAYKIIKNNVDEHEQETLLCGLLHHVVCSRTCSYAHPCVH